jgi:Fe-S-cluster containining protein
MGGSPFPHEVSLAQSSAAWAPPRLLQDARARPGLDGISLTGLLPLARELADGLSHEAVAAARAEGRSVPCRDGCAACCRQLVTISLVEAVGLADTVAAMPPQRQSRIRRRFAEVIGRLEEAGMLDPREPRGQRRLTARAGDLREDVLPRLSRDYFSLGLACPFLDHESCSIHGARPGICREYHVSSPAERCRQLYDGPGVDRVTPGIRVGPALMWAAHQVAGTMAGQIPLVLALEWAESAGPALRLPREGAAVRSAFFDALDRAARGDAGPAVPAPPPAPDGATLTATLGLSIRARRLELKVTVPAGATSARRLLPIAQSLTDAASRIAGEDAAAAGRPVTCAAGCGACCRNLVPLGRAEAYHVAAVVAALPEPRRSEVRGRFAAALPVLERAGLLTQARDVAAGRGRWEYGLEYFRLGIPCPFLEQESCSIYPDRPLVCREYLVSSPPPRCARPESGGIEEIPLPIQEPMRAFARAAGGLGAEDPVPWVPLILALEWTASNPEPDSAGTGPDLLRSVVQQLTAAAPAP